MSRQQPQNYVGTNEDAAIFLNIIVIVLVVIGLYNGIRARGAILLADYGALANILGAIASAFYVLVAGTSRRRFSQVESQLSKSREDRRSHRSADRKKMEEAAKFASDSYKMAREFHYLAVCCMVMTFFGAVLLVAPMSSGSAADVIWADGQKYIVIFCPLVSFLSFIFLEPGRAFTKKEIAKTMIPTALYGLILLVLNGAGVFRGPYPFLLVRQQPVYFTIIGCAVILAVSYAVGLLVSYLNQRHAEQ